MEALVHLPSFADRPAHHIQANVHSPAPAGEWGGHLFARDDDHIGSTSSILATLWSTPGRTSVTCQCSRRLRARRSFHSSRTRSCCPFCGRTSGRAVTCGRWRSGRAAIKAHALIAPDPAAHNSGLGRLGTSDDEGTVPVQVERLDDELQGRAVSILKMDVEGAEEVLLEGAATALRDRRLSHIIFEDHHGAGSAVMTRLMAYGYTVYSIGWTLTGPALGDPGTVSAHARFEAPSYLATLRPDVARATCTRRGWIALRRAHPV